MIRLIQRRLIIPRGDTGSFTIPIQGTVGNGDSAVFYIYDPIYKQSVHAIKGIIANDVITVPFVREDTINLSPKKYLWDIVIYKNPQYEEGDESRIRPINGDEINSYYAAFSLPVCEIREVAQDV